ncbi:MAG: lysine--tRNA ligase [Atopobiaceae bacterium]|jgi:lysyl-tRNA synthetase class 2|nr:lysine--tRNA ligase [Atopobiaceae bacterium]
MSDQTKPGDPIDTTDERAMRRARRQAMIDAGIDPYPIRSTVSAHAAELEGRYAALADGSDTADVVSVAGRIRALRNQGKVAFLVLQDSTGTIQLFCRVNVLGEAGWDLLGQLDVGDIVGATGTVVRTRRGQLSISPTSVELLAKSCRPLPEKFHGLSDKETRYRQRYVDLIMNDDVRETFRKRSVIISAIRSFMNDQDYLEVETPILQETLGGANAKPFVTHFNALDQECYLRIATELHLKRLIVGGFERVYELGRQFRNEGMDLTHNPEFTSMEAYCAYSDLEGMKRLSEGLFKAANAAVNDSERIQFQGREIDLSGTWRTAPMHELVSEAVGEEVSIDTPVARLRELLDANGLEWEDSWGAGKLLFTLYDELVEKTIVDPTFVCDYPVEVSPLTKRKPDDPRLTDRFELVIAGNEYANAFSELNDPVDQEARFAAQVEAKAAGDEEAMDYDADYIRALEYGMPPAGGIGYGIDRMVMLLTNQASIRDVLLFPHMRPERGAAPKAAPAAGTALGSGLTRDQAFALLEAHNSDSFHITHGETLEGLMRHYAHVFDPGNVEFWGQVGLLHDVDWEETSDDPASHTVRAAEIISEAGGTPELVRSIQTHNSDNNPDLPAPELKMERVLFAVDELSGLVGACVAMRPSHSVMDFSVKSLRKKFKQRSFAAGCDRDVIAKGAELNGMELDELFASVIEAMKAIAPDRDTFVPEA